MSSLQERAEVFARQYACGAAICSEDYSVQDVAYAGYVRGASDEILARGWRSSEDHPDISEGRVLLLGEFCGSETVTGGYYDEGLETWCPDIKDGFHITGWHSLGSH